MSGILCAVCVSVNLSCIQVTEYHAARFLVNRFFLRRPARSPCSYPDRACRGSRGARGYLGIFMNGGKLERRPDWIGVFRRSSAGLRPHRLPLDEASAEPYRVEVSCLEVRFRERVATRTGVMCESIRDVQESGEVELPRARPARRVMIGYCPDDIVGEAP